MSDTTISGLGGPSGFVPLPSLVPASTNSHDPASAAGGDQLTLSDAAQKAVGGPDDGGWLGAGLDALKRLQGGLLSFLGQGVGAGGDLIDSLQKSLLEPVHDAVGALAQQAADGGTGAVAGHATLSIQGISLHISASKDGIDVSFDEVSVQAESDVAAVSKDGTFAAYAGFAAEVSTVHVSLHIGAAGSGAGTAPGQSNGQSDGSTGASDPNQPVVLNLLGPDDRRNLGPDGKPRTDPAYLPDLSGVTGGLTQLLKFLRAVAADATGAAGGASDRGAPAAPTLLVLRDHHQDENGDTHLLLDAHQPFSPGGPSPTDQSQSGSGLNIQA